MQQHVHDPRIKLHCYTTVDMMQPFFDIVSTLSRCCCLYACFVNSTVNSGRFRKKKWTKPNVPVQNTPWPYPGVNDTRRARASPCSVQTYYSSKQQQEAVELCSITTSRGCFCCCCVIRTWYLACDYVLSYGYIPLSGNTNIVRIFVMIPNVYYITYKNGTW